MKQKFLVELGSIIKLGGFVRRAHNVKDNIREDIGILIL